MFEHTPAGVMIEKNSIKDVVFRMSFQEMRKYLLAMYLWNNTSNLTLDEALSEAERQLKATERCVDNGITAKVILEKTEYFLNEKRENYEKMCNPQPIQVDVFENTTKEPLKKRVACSPTKEEIENKEVYKEVAERLGIPVESVRKLDEELWKQGVECTGKPVERLREEHEEFYNRLAETRGETVEAIRKGWRCWGLEELFYSKKENHLPYARKIALYLKKRGETIVPLGEIGRDLKLDILQMFFGVQCLRLRGLVEDKRGEIVEVSPKLYDAWDLFLDSESLEREFFTLN